MELPGYTKEESIDLLLRAMMDTSNREILPQIVKALMKLGLSETEIKHYEIWDELPFDSKFKEGFEEMSREFDEFHEDMKEFQTEINTERSEIDRSFKDITESLRRKGKAAKTIAITSFALVTLIMFGILFAFMISDSDEDTSDPPAIIEQAPVSHGDKL